LVKFSSLKSLSPKYEARAPPKPEKIRPDLPLIRFPLSLAGSRTFVQSGVYDKFVALAKAKAEQRKVGDPWSKDSEQGPIRRNSHFGRNVLGQIIILVKRIKFIKNPKITYNNLFNSNGQEFYH
jgi:hypothetical protein